MFNNIIEPHRKETITKRTYADAFPLAARDASLLAGAHDLGAHVEDVQQLLGLQHHGHALGGGQETTAVEQQCRVDDVLLHAELLAHDVLLRYVGGALPEAL
jgi:hypothetical protein